MENERMQDYSQLRDNIKNFVQVEIENYMKKNNFYCTHSGTVIDVSEGKEDNPFQQICGVDLVYTQVKSLLNKSGQSLKIGDSVIVFEKVGSHFSNCFIAYKNA